MRIPASDMLIKPARLVSLLARDMTLVPGDVIACGTSVGAGNDEAGVADRGRHRRHRHARQPLRSLAQRARGGEPGPVRLAKYRKAGPRNAPKRATMASELRDYLSIPYGELEELNLEAKK